MFIFGHFSHVKRAKHKIAFLQRKECSNQKIEENKSGLEFNFLLKSKCPSLNFEIWVFGANLTEPYMLNPQLDLKSNKDGPCSNSTAEAISNQSSTDLQKLEEKVKTMMEKGQKMIHVDKKANGTPIQFTSKLQSVWQGRTQVFIEGPH